MSEESKESPLPWQEDGTVLDSGARMDRGATGDEVMRYILKMLACFAVSMYLVVKSADLAADGKPVAACILGVFVFGLFFWMAAESVKAEKEAAKK